MERARTSGHTKNAFWENHIEERERSPCRYSLDRRLLQMQDAHLQDDSLVRYLIRVILM